MGNINDNYFNYNELGNDEFYGINIAITNSNAEYQ